MFDFRYHALSLVAVFVALAIGLLLGVAIGDAELVSSAQKRLSDDLSSDLRKARSEGAGLRRELDRRRSYEDQTYPRLVADRLDGRRIIVLFLDERSDPIFGHVRDALRPSGGELSFLATLKRPVDLDAIGRLASGTRYENLAEDPTLLDDLGHRIGVQLAQGGRLLDALRSELLTASSGELEPAEGVVVVRTGQGRGGADAEQQTNEFADGLIDGLESLGTPVVGVEQSSTEPSQIPWYQDHGVPSVDHVDEVAGRATLVFALAGSAEGTYGRKPTADAYIPEALTRP